MLGKTHEPTTLKPGDRVYHSKDPSLKGFVHSVDDPPYSVMVLWDGGSDWDELDLDFQWANKLVLEEDPGVP